ncbi:type II toxin-antitoxin system HicB family antitoxin [Xenorhabdus bharatensis]|uniref:type II toxin-antitoxin system HicB family antitoxin n=1 Tax=Xenorhabdus bharatensis TaxID=3136256 RepID=UPI0030F3D2E4
MSKKHTNIMEIAEHQAVISYVPEIRMFRGKFLGLSGYCDFVADSIAGLHTEGRLSLDEYLEDCRIADIEPYQQREKTKNFTLRYPESFGERLIQAAAEHQMSINAFILDTLDERIHHK